MTNRERASSSEATQPATPERQREARRRGQVALSADLNAAVALAAALVVFVAAAPAAMTRLLLFLRAAVAQAMRAAFSGGGDTAVLATAGDAALAVALPLVIVPGAAALAVTVLFGVVQTGGLFSLAIARPEVARSSALAGLRRLLGAATAIEVGRASLKVALVVAVAATALLPLVRALPELTRATPATILASMGTLSLRVAARAVVALIAWGIGDWALARWRHQRALAMTRDEVRREKREREGDPRQRTEHRRRHREAAAQASPADAGGADLVIVGRDADGTDLAVALVYDRANGRAPLVLVSGRGPAADRIQQASTRTGTRTVSVHFDGALAAALVHLPAGQEIPESCFERVAALLRPLLSPSGRVEGPVATP